MKFFFVLFVILVLCFKNAQADEVNCLALNIYHEARNQPLVGKLAVAQVTINRVNDNRFPDTLCAVVMQGFYHNHFPIKHKCQFSWWCDGKSDKPKDKESWQKIQILAFKIKKKKKVLIIADHIFYK